ncbi:MAG: sulfotransferase [Roseivirga sp.]|nr:sulfotransferase [Roseivirga sp.]
MDLRNEAAPMCIVVGMPRAGTTFLYYYLSQHPDVFAPARKEVNYFSVFYERGAAWYDSLYKGITPVQSGIDASPFYYLDARSVHRIAKDQKNAFVVLGIRQPSEMVCAMYERIRSSTLDMPPFQSFLETFHWDIGSGLTLSLKEFPFLQRIKEYQELFGDRLLLYSFEALNKSPLSVLNAVESHIRVKNHFNEDNFTNIIINASKRRHNRRLSQFLKNEKLIDWLIRLLPRKAINRSREIFLKFSKAKTDSGKPPLDPANMELSRSYFEKEDLAVARLFGESDFIRGNQNIEV